MQAVVGDDKRIFELTFLGSEINTDDEREWDAICDRVESALAAAGEMVAQGQTAEIRIKITPQRAH